MRCLTIGSRTWAFHERSINIIQIYPTRPFLLVLWTSDSWCENEGKVESRISAEISFWPKETWPPTNPDPECGRPFCCTQPHVYHFLRQEQILFFLFGEREILHQTIKPSNIHIHPNWNHFVDWDEATQCNQLVACPDCAPFWTRWVYSVCCM